MSKDPDEPQEPAAGEKKRRYWLATSRKAKRKAHPPAAPGEPQRVHIVSGHNFRAKAKQEPQDTDYTGRYESAWPTTQQEFAGSYWILLINQASTAVEGVLVEALWGRSERARKSWPFSGTVKGHDAIAVGADNPPGQPGVTGTIGKVGDDLLVSLTLPTDPHLRHQIEGPTGVTFTLMPHGKRPSYLGDAVEAMFANSPVPPGPQQAAQKQARELIVYAESHPLHTFQVAILEHLLLDGDADAETPPRLERLIRSALLGKEWTEEDDSDWAESKRKALPSGSDFADDVNKTNAVVKLDEHIRDVFLTKPPTDWDHKEYLLFNRSDIPLLQYEAQLILAHHKCRGNTKDVRTYLQWIQALAAHARTSTRQEAKLPWISEFLGIDVAAEGTPFAEYEYELTFDFSTEKNKEIKKKVEDGKKALKSAGKKLPAIPKGAVVDWGFGTLKVKKTKGPGADWEKTFEVKYAGFGPGFGGPGDLSSTAKLLSYEEWKFNDFPGPFKIFDGAASAKAKPSDILKIIKVTKNEKLEKQIGKGLDKVGKKLPMPQVGDRGMALEISGGGNHRRVIVDLQFKEEQRRQTGLNLYLFVAFGWISKLDGLEHMDFSSVPEQKDLELQQQAQKQYQFKLNWAVLEPSGRNLLRRFCARELPWLMNPTSALSITGHCDRIASASYNQVLSENRAHNVAQVIKDIMGKNLKAKLADEDIVGLGKQEAERAFRESGGKEPLINRGRRRVDVVLNGRGVLSLWGEEDK